MVNLETFLKKHSKTKQSTAARVRRKSEAKALIHRDQVHGDAHYDALSAALLNTDALQRLGRVYQLGYAHLVFRGGTHTRLSHVMGAAYMAGEIVDTLKLNYRQKRSAPRHVSDPIDFLPGISSRQPEQLDARWELLRHLVVWAALLHDVGHVPLGHTLEDEFEGIFKKHDDFASPRSLELWNEGSEISQILQDESLYPNSFPLFGISPKQIWQTVMLICFYKDVSKDKEGRYADFPSFLAHRIQKANSVTNESHDSSVKSELEIEKKFATLLLNAWQETNLLFKPFMTDIVANTICADYLDYVRRDPINVGLDVLKDNRILSNFYVSEQPTTRYHRMALALLDRNGKPRLDVCTGVVEQVRQRYRFAELIYYHKTKVSASAMFARAMNLIGKPPEIARKQTALYEADFDLEKLARNLSRRSSTFSSFKSGCLPSALLHPEIGDESLHMFLTQQAIGNIEEILARKNVSAHGKDIELQLRGIALLQAISRRRLYKVAMSINAGQFGRLTRGASQEKVAEERLKTALEKLRGDGLQRQLRERIEQKMSKEAGWPPESILLYVPERKTQAKGIDTFAFDEHGVVRLNEHPAVSEKVNELGRDYQKLWRLIVLVHPEFRDQALPLSEAIDVLVRELWCDFQTEGQVDLHDPQRLAVIQEVAWFPYIRKAHREAAEDMQELSIDLNGNPIKINWDLFERAPVRTTLSEGTLTSKQYAERALLLQTLVEQWGATPRCEDLAIEEIKKRYGLPETTIQPRDEKRFELEFQKLTSKNVSWAYDQKEDAKRAFAIKRVAQEIAGEIEVRGSVDTQVDKVRGRRTRRPPSKSHSRNSIRPSGLSRSASKRRLRAKHHQRNA